LECGTFEVGASVETQIDEARRAAIMRAHSVTHLLQKALRNHLGAHVEQAGSYVTPDNARFDFTHFSALTADEIAAVEAEVNAQILAGLTIDTREMPIDDAKKLGAMALFGEKYGDVVRVVKMGDYSIELCGGTHMDNTAKAGLFKITAETSVAAGVRRVEAICGSAVLDKMSATNATLLEVAEVLKTAPHEVVTKATQTANEVKALKAELAALKDKMAAFDAQDMVNDAIDVNGLKVIAVKKDGASGDSLRTIGDSLRGMSDDIVALLAGVTDGKIVFVASCGKNAVAKGVKAGNLVREVATICGGKGGGKPDSAMAGGSDVSKLDEALAFVQGFVADNSK